MNRPAWLQQEKIIKTLDARPILASGQHPLEIVLQETKNLHTGDIFEIITPFPPSPMIEKMAASGFETYLESPGDGTFRVYFRK